MLDYAYTRAEFAQLAVMPDTVAVGRTPVAAREIQRPQAAFPGVNGKIKLPEDADRHTRVVFRGDLHQQVSVRPAIKAYQPTFACARTRRASQSKADAQVCVVRCARLAKRLERMTCMRTRRTVEPMDDLHEDAAHGGADARARDDVRGWPQPEIRDHRERLTAQCIPVSKQ